MSDPALPPLLLLAGVLSVPVGLLAALAFVRVVSPWSAVVAAHGMVLPPPANAHRVGGQTIRLGPTFSIYALARVVVSKDTLWVGFSAPASWFFKEVMVPLDEVTLDAVCRMLYGGGPAKVKRPRKPARKPVRKPRSKANG